jgi:hypothetical protein
MVGRVASSLVAVAALCVLLPGENAAAATRCQKLLSQLGATLADASCVESTDLTTNNPATTPANNSLPGLPPFAFTPQTDRAVISPNPPNRTPITKTVPGIQVQARIADDPTGEARILFRLPNQWNGKLVVAGASGTRSEFNGDFAWSDFVLQKGFAYVSQNKGVFNLALSTAADPLACRLNPELPVFVHFFDNDPGQPFTRWTDIIIEATKIGKRAVGINYGDEPERTYVVGTSNGGYQVRRAIETAPELFDGGVDWEGTFVDPVAPNLLSMLPPTVLNFPSYVSGGLDPDSLAAQNIEAAGYPPDIIAGTNSFWGFHNDQFWEVTFCQWQKRLDPTYNTYVTGTGTYTYQARLSASDVGANVAAITNSGDIKRPLITVQGTMDALLPINEHGRAYARKVAAALAARDHDEDHQGDNHHGGDHDDAKAANLYRLYEVQNGNHIETFKDTFPQLEFIQPHAQRAFELLVDHVEHGGTLPPDQCIPRGGAIAATPAEPGHCASLLAP